MFVRVVRVLFADGLSTYSEFTPPLVALCVLHVGFEIYDEEGDVDSHSECRCLVYDGVLVFLKQFAHAFGFVQCVELFLGHLFELFDELDDVVVLVLACIIDGQFDLFQLFDGVDFVFASCAPNRIAHGFGRVGILVPVTLVLES